MAAYSGVVERMHGAALAGSRSRLVAGRVLRGLIQVLAGADPAPARQWRSRWHRRALYSALAIATLVLTAVSLKGIIHFPGNDFRAPRFRHGLLSFLLPSAVGTPHAIAVLVAVAAVAPLPMAARYPLLSWRIAWLALLLVPLSRISWQGGWPWDAAQIVVLLVVFYLAGLRLQRPLLWWMWALSLIPWWLSAWPTGPGLVTRALGTMALTAAAIAADSVSSRRRAQEALADQAERTELEQARRAVLEERAKMARELHDVVAHHMSLIAVRAETAPYRLSGLPEPARAEFGSLSEAAREAMTDMRRLLGVLRNDQPAGRTPQPRLSDLPMLIEALRQAGVPVEMTAAPALDRVPPGVGMCAYRIVQESLSNASRHAPGAAVTVSVDHGADSVRLRVANGPGETASPAVNGDSQGQGLAGMRERAALLGGWLSAGPSSDGGFVVSAMLPLGAA